MDREKVIAWLADEELYYRDHGDTHNSLMACNALALLKEQEPLAVYEGKVNKCICGNEINRYWHPEYCGFCGKKLLWY